MTSIEILLGSPIVEGLPLSTKRTTYAYKNKPVNVAPALVHRNSRRGVCGGRGQGVIYVDGLFREPGGRPRMSRGCILLVRFRGTWSSSTGRTLFGLLVRRRGTWSSSTVVLSLGFQCKVVVRRDCHGVVCIIQNTLIWYFVALDTVNNSLIWDKTYRSHVAAKGKMLVACGRWGLM